MTEFAYTASFTTPSPADPIPLIWRPILQFDIFGLTRHIQISALLDTGAVETMVPMRYWDAIDPAHIIDEVGELQAANGTPIRVQYATVDLGFQLGPTFHRWHAKVGFSPGRDEMVAGDAGFLRYFAVTFDRAHRVFSIRRNADLPIPLMPAGAPPKPRPPVRPERRRPRR